MGTPRFQELLDKEESGVELDLYEWQVVRQVTSMREKKATRRAEKECHSLEEWEKLADEGDKKFDWVKLQKEEGWEFPIQAAHCSGEGMRNGQEDAYIVTGNQRFRLYGVFDGHAGDAAAKYAAEKLGAFLFEDFSDSK